MCEEKKVRMAEPSGDTEHQLQDKGYKKLFENKEMFLEFLQTFVHEEWVKDINEEDLVRVDKEYILQDYRKKEADVVYKMKLKSPVTGKEKEVIFYILLELQSSVDRMMPYRLLMYMVQIWKYELTNVKYEDAQEQDYKLPAIVPIVLYNGSKKWDAVMRFRDLLNEADRFGNYLVDFQYILVSVDNYSEEDLLRIANAIAYVIMMDQTIVAKDKAVMRRRLNEIVQRKDKLTSEKMELILEWLLEVFIKRFPEEEARKIIESLKEGKDMTYAIERLFDDVERKGIEKGIEKGMEKGIEKGMEKGEEKGDEKRKKKTAMNLFGLGLTIEQIAGAIELSVEEVMKLKNEIEN